MPVERVLDDGGDAMTLIRYSGDRFGASDFHEAMLEDCRNVVLKDGDVLLCSYSKSGCHWMWETLRCLQHGRTDLDLEEKEGHMIEFQTHESLAALPSPRVLNNHLPWDSQPDDVFRKKVKVVFFYRNPKDVAVSFYHHHLKFSDYDYSGKFDNYLRRLVQGKVDNGNLFKYIREWETGIRDNPQLPVFVGCYENMTQFPQQELRRLSSFLGHEYNDQFLKDVTSATSFGSMRQRKFPVTFKDKDGQPIMYRKGIVGDWQNYFTVNQNTWFDDVIEQSMKESKISFRYSLNDPLTLDRDKKLSTFPVLHYNIDHLV